MQLSCSLGVARLYSSTVLFPIHRYILLGDGTYRKKTVSFASIFPRIICLLPRYLRFYLVTSRMFGASQRDSSIFFTPNGTGHNDGLAIVRYTRLHHEAYRSVVNINVYFVLCGAAGSDRFRAACFRGTRE